MIRPWMQDATDQKDQKKAPTKMTITRQTGRHHLRSKIKP
jgi:hypothetical protein